MNTTEHPVRQLLWCALNALHAAQENHGINSESGLRRYLLEWLSGAGRHPEFRNIPEEIMALKALAEQDRDIPITGTLNTLFLSSATVGECPLFRFRAAMGRLQKAGWRTTVCPWTERVFSESIELACTGRRHLLQLSRTEECFMPSGQMCAPVYLQLITPEAMHHHWKVLNRLLTTALSQGKRVSMTSHLLTQARTGKLVRTLQKQGVAVTVKREECLTPAFERWTITASKTISQWKIPHVNRHSGIVILTPESWRQP